MRKVFMVLVILAMFATSAFAQSGYVSGRYYSQRYSITDVPVGPVYYQWDDWGNRYAFQQYRRARWYSNSGGQYTYQWYNGMWQRQWYNGQSYYYDWVFYTKRLW